MPFDKQPPRWEAQGTEPPESKKNSGWAPGEKPAAGYFNWFFAKVYAAIKELQEKVAERTTLDAHTATSTGVHGATSAATASRIMQRDASGRAKVAAPAAADDVARKAEVDAVQSSLTAHASSQASHVSTADRTKWNGGAGSGLNADMVDGYHLDQDVRKTANVQFNSMTISDSATFSGGLYAYGGGAEVNYLNVMQNATFEGPTQFYDAVSTSGEFRINNASGAEQLALLANGDIRQRGQVLAPTRVQGGNLEYWDGANFIPVLRQQGGIAGNGANMNNFQTTGVYRLGENNANGPAGVDINYSQLAVFNGGADTVGQAIFVWGSGDMWIRTGTTSNNWKPWKRATGQTTVSSAAPSGGFDGDVWFQV